MFGSIHSGPQTNIRDGPLQRAQTRIIAPQLLKRVHERAVTSAVLTGDLVAPDFFADRRTWTAAEWIMPIQPWVDPKKESEAVAAQIEAGLTSRRKAVAQLGWSVEALDAEIASDRTREAALGLSFGAAAAQPQALESSDEE